MMESKNIHDGPVWAAILAAGVGCAAFGVLVDAAEASKAISAELNFYNPTGDLSGKSTIAVVVWLIVWAVLHLVWRGKSVSKPGLVMIISIILVLSSLVTTFPKFFGLLG
jgi:hypothetical protein